MSDKSSAKKLWKLVLKGAEQEVVKFLQEYDSVLDTPDKNGRLPLHVAAMRGSKAIADELVRCKTNVNSVDKQGASALHIAAGLGIVPVVQTLLAAQADPFVTTNSMTALDYASTGDLSVVAKMVSDSKKFNKKGRAECKQLLVAYEKTLAASHAGVPGFTGVSRVEPTANMDGIKMSFSSVDATTFNLRLPNYKTEVKKGPSQQSFYDIHTVDVFTSEAKATNVVRFLKLPELDHHADWKGLDGVPKFLAFMVMVPLYKPVTVLYGETPKDGKGIQILFLFALSEYGKAQLTACETNSAKTVKRFLTDDDLKFRAQHKGIARIANPSDVDFGRMGNKLISSYNGKPFMTGPTCHRFFEGENYLEINNDIHTFC